MKFFCGKQYAKIDLAGFFQRGPLTRICYVMQNVDGAVIDEFEICLCIWNI